MSKHEDRRRETEAAWGQAVTELLGDREANGWGPTPESSADQRTVVTLKDGSSLTGAMVGPIGDWLAFDGYGEQGEYRYQLIARDSIAVISFASED